MTIGSLQSSLLARDGRRGATRQNTGDTRVFEKINLINRAGEATFKVDFNWEFTEKPLFTFGGELDDNERIVAGAFPTVSAVVYRWITKGTVGATADSNHRRYTGAHIAVVTTGRAAQRMHVHLRFEGLAIVAPMAGTGGPEDPI